MIVMISFQGRQGFLRSTQKFAFQNGGKGISLAPCRAGFVRPRQATSSALSFPGARYYSSPTSNAFWRDLNLAVKHGRGEEAEEIVNMLLKNYHNASDVRLDTRIFSLVLEAWRSSDSALAPKRALQLLEQMIELAEEGILRDPPSVDDYHAVLECWAVASTNDASLQAAESALRITQRMMKDHAPSERTFLLVLQVLANGGHAPSARQFLDTLPEHIPPTVEMYNLVLSSFLLSPLPDAAKQAQELLDQMQATYNDLPEPNNVSYDLVIQCWAQHSQSAEDPEAGDKAQKLLSRMKSRQLQTTLASYQNIIQLLAQKGEAKQAEQLLTGLVKDYGAQFDAQLKPTLAPFEAVLLAYSRFFHADAAQRAESLLIHMRELYETGLLESPPDAWSYNIVLKCYVHSKHPQAAERALTLLDQMRADHVMPDTSTMNTILNILSKQKNPVEAERFLWDFYQSYLEDPIHNPQPDVISFGTVLKAWSQAKNSHATERAEALLLKLQNLYESGWDRCQPDQAIYSCVMKCYAGSKDKDAPHKAEAILRTMQRSAKENENPSLKPDAVSWNMAIQAWANAGNGPRAETLFKEMLEDYMANPETGAAPNKITFSAVLSAWAKTQHNSQASVRAQAILEQMKQLAESDRIPGIEPNVVSYSIVLDCLAYAKTTAAAIRAESILREMQSSDNPAVQPNVISYNSVIKAWSLSRDPNALFRVTILLKEMLQEVERHGKIQMTPNANTFGSILKILADSNVPDKEERAQVVSDLMEKHGVSWNDWSRNQWRRCLKSSGTPGGRQRRRGGIGDRKPEDIPEIPDLKYS